MADATTTLTDAKRRLLGQLKIRGASTSSDLARLLELTEAAVRQHLLALQELGLVEPQAKPPAGRGRPSSRWALTAEADALFPDRHGELTVGLIQAIRESVGERGLRRIVEVRARDQLNLYREQLPAGSPSLKARVEALARQRTAEGYMAEVVQEKPGQYLLIEHHCPICDAARECQGFCVAELDVFKETLGRDVHIERTEHLLSEGRRCVYRICRKRRAAG